jgi:hypothetical protein
MDSDRFTTVSSTTDMLDAVSSGGLDVEHANPAYLYKGPITPRMADGATASASTPEAKKSGKGVFGVSGLTGAMQVSFAVSSGELWVLLVASSL